MKIHFADSQYTIPKNFKQKYLHEIKAAHKEVMKLLPFGSKHINFIVQPRTWGLIENTGGNARTYNSEIIELAFDPTFKQASHKAILQDARHSVYHEMNHAARYNINIWHKTFLDNCIMEGLATVFARDYSGEKAPWAKYPKNVTAWIKEIIDKNDMFSWPNYSFDHPDGRKWIAYKVGTYIVDEAMKKSGKSVIELTKTECADILKLAGIDTVNYRSLV